MVVEFTPDDPRGRPPRRQVCVCVCVFFFLVGYPESGPRRNAAEALDANRTLSGHLLDVTLQSLKTGKGVVVDRGAYGSASCSPPVARWWW